MIQAGYKYFIIIMLSLSACVAHGGAAAVSNALQVLQAITAKGPDVPKATGSAYAVAITAPIANVWYAFMMANGACAEYQLNAANLGLVNAAIQKGLALTVIPSVAANATVATQWDINILVSDMQGNTVAQESFQNVINTCSSVTGLAKNAVITSSTNPFTSIMYDIVLTQPAGLNLSYRYVPLSSNLQLIPVTLSTIIPEPTSTSDLSTGQSLSAVSITLGTATAMLYGVVSLNEESLSAVNSAIQGGVNVNFDVVVQPNPINTMNQDVIVVVYDLNDTMIVSQMFQNVVNVASVQNAANVAGGAPITSATPISYYNANIAITGSSKSLQLNANIDQVVGLRVQTVAPKAVGALKKQALFLASLSSAGMTVSTAAMLAQETIIPSWNVTINGAWTHSFITSGTVPKKGAIDLTKVVAGLTPAQFDAGVSTIMLAVDATGTIIVDITKTAPAGWVLYMFDATGAALPNSPVSVPVASGLPIGNTTQSATAVYPSADIAFAVPGTNIPIINGTYPVMLTLQTTQTALSTQPIYLNAPLQAFGATAWVGNVSYLWSHFSLQPTTISAINTAVAAGSAAILNAIIVPNANTGFYDATWWALNPAQTILAVETYPSIVNTSAATIPVGRYPVNKPYPYIDPSTKGTSTPVTLLFAAANAAYQLAGQNVIGITGVSLSSKTMFTFMPAQV